MQLDSAMDFVQLRSGSALVGEVKNPTFRLRLDGSDTELVLRNEKIISVAFRDPGFGDTRDRVTMTNGTQLFGDVLDETVAFRSGGTGDMDIPTEDVLALQLTFSFFS